MQKAANVLLGVLVVMALWGVLARAGGKGIGQEPACPKAYFSADANGDGEIDVSDPINLLNWLFAQGPPPPCFAQEVSCCDTLIQETNQLRTEFAVLRERVETV